MKAYEIHAYLLKINTTGCFDVFFYSQWWSDKSGKRLSKVEYFSEVLIETEFSAGSADFSAFEEKWCAQVDVQLRKRSVHKVINSA